MVICYIGCNLSYTQKNLFLNVENVFLDILSLKIKLLPLGIVYDFYTKLISFKLSMKILRNRIGLLKNLTFSATSIFLKIKHQFRDQFLKILENVINFAHVRLTTNNRIYNPYNLTKYIFNYPYQASQHWFENFTPMCH